MLTTMTESPSTPAEPPTPASAGGVDAIGVRPTVPPPARTLPDEGAAAAGSIDVQGLNVYYGAFRAIRDISLTIRPNAVTAIIGPSGCGKSTFLRTLNRMHELTPTARVEGSIQLDGTDIMAPDVDPVQLRRVVGMVLQRPNPFPTMSIYDNVVAGLRLTG